ncbi:uncharacterized protein HMPREF1541_10694 [Cyphellophora europaea CBS 101466]|uniref:DUF1223-domain-containing protein n=1 Tax=Cyphellophora europaea (strain CBS 101466) TaxID=1220924 RepID=W2S880_CYPE1|nr:uncharacterized protein HMPREF1541_10694 [Cyphellophora europaea CBS 101466]ETN44144.1 hypothetical protein HMPREF1541_10694 [Cyphellophora europaea CBS 101466]
MSFFRTLFFRKKKAPLVCTIDLAHDPNHVHTDACFVEIAPLSIVEFFMSQGCEACPAAIPLIHKSAMANNNVLLLTYNVTYFNNRTGWTDTKSNTLWDARQAAYSKRWSRTAAFTPQVIIDGIADGTGAKEGDFNSILSNAIEARNNSPLAVGMEKVDNRRLKIASETVETEVYDVVVISYEARAEVVKVGKGPNKGKKLEHRNVVREVVKIEEWAGGPKVLELLEMPEGNALQHVVVLQQGVGGPIVAACRL